MAEHADQQTTSGPEGPLTRLPVSAVLILLGLTLVWGSTYPAMKIAGSEIPLFTFRGSIATCAGAIMLLMAKLGGHSLAVPAENRKGLLIACFLNTAGIHVFTTLGTLHISAGQTALIVYTMPLWAFLIAIPVLRERPARAHWLGLLLGLSGIGVIAAQHTGTTWIAPGILAALCAAIAWAGGTIANKQIDWKMPLMTMAAWQLFLGGLGMAILALFELDTLEPVSMRAVAAATYMIFLPLIYGYWAFFRITQMAPASVASLSVVAVPGVSLALGPFLVGEPITTQDMIAFALIAGALLTVLPLPRLRRPAPAETLGR